MTSSRLISIFIVIAAFVAAFAGYKGKDTASASSLHADGFSSGQPVAAAPAPSGFGPTKNVEIIDPAFGMVAYTMTIPASWKFEGTVLHGPGCSLESIIPVYRAYSPDMRYGIQLAPRANLVWADDERARPKGPDCKLLPPMSAAAYGTLVSIRMRPGAQIDKVEPPPPPDRMAAQVEQNNQANAASHIPSRLKWDAQRIFIHYDMNGQPEEELLSVGMMVNVGQGSFVANQPGGRVGTITYHSYTSNADIAGLRAPAGQLQSHLSDLQAIRMTYKEVPAYQARVTKYLHDKVANALARDRQIFNTFQQQSKQQMEQRHQQAEAFIQNMQQQGDTRRENFNATMLQRSAHAQDVCDYLLDQQLFVNPATGEQSKAGNQFDHTFTNGPTSSNSTTTIQTNSPTYNPNGLVSGNWTELQPIHH